MLKKYPLYILFFILPFNKSHSQCALFPVSIEERIKESNLIIEGRVVESFSFWDDNHDRIYTCNKINIYKIFKGTNNSSQIRVITSGGIVDGDMELNSSLLSLEIGECGIFICKPSGTKMPDQKQINDSLTYEVVASKQGFIKYDTLSMRANDVFVNYISKNQVYQLMDSLTQHSFLEIRKEEFGSFSSSVSAKLALTPVIKSFDPPITTAGTSSAITIKGSGFGSKTATNSVSFKNADDGGQSSVNPFPFQYKSWNDTSIVVVVPNKAGTGRVQVTNGQGTGTSVAILTIDYARTNAKENPYEYPTFLMGKSGGGYSWKMNANFNADSLKKNSFLNAFRTWRCGTYVNWTCDSITTINRAVSDNVNVILFDTYSKLPSGVLGQCTSYYASCKGVWYVKEYDIQFHDGVNWNYSLSNAGPTQVDFQSIATHELGHGNQLGHVNAPNDIMYYGGPPGQTRRILNANNIKGGTSIVNESSNNKNCNIPPMKPLNADICSIASLAFFDFSTKIFPNPFYSDLQIDYSLGYDATMTIILYNSMGQNIATLLNEAQKIGEYKYVFNVSTHNLPNGMYFLRLVVNGNVFTKKVIFLNQ